MGLGLVTNCDRVDQPVAVDSSPTKQIDIITRLGQHRPVDAERASRHTLHIELQMFAAVVRVPECPAQVFGVAMRDDDGTVADTAQPVVGYAQLRVLGVDVEKRILHPLKELHANCRDGSSHFDSDHSVSAVAAARFQSVPSTMYLTIFTSSLGRSFEAGSWIMWSFGSDLQWVTM